MPNFGDEWIIESYKVPWLIWIQLVVMILLIMLLLFGFTLFTSDSSAVLQSTGAAAAAPPTHLNKPSSSNRFFKVENQRDRRGQGTSRELVREEDQSGEESSTKDSMFFRIFRHTNNFIGQAKRALLKCLGLDTNSDQHEKQE